MMRMKRFFAIVVTLALLLGVLPPQAIAIGPWMQGTASNRENVLFELLEDKLNLNLFQNSWNDELKIEKIEEDEEVKIFIIMDEKSVVESDSEAVYGEATQAMMDALATKQAQVIEAIEQSVLAGQQLPVNYRYTWLLNGIATQVPYGLLDEIEKIPGVKQVLLQPRYDTCQSQPISGSAQLMTTTSNSMTGRDEAWSSGYTGQGIRIAIIDTGLDDDHPNFQPLPQDKLTETSYDLEDIAAVLDQMHATKRYNEKAVINNTEMLTAENLYRNSKLIFGFNYADNNLNITHDLDTMGDHGTHVAGIAAANKIDGSDVVGVAPDAQLYIMKVFGADHGGYAEDILAALEDALLLGADVINMSLGTNAGFTTSTEDVNAIYNRVSETNSVLSIAAGNNYTSGFGNTWGDNKNQTMHPDNAVISQPGIYSNALSVASVENTHIWRRYIAAGTRKLAFIETSTTYEMPSIDTLEEVYGLVLVPNLGAEADYEGLDVTGKIVLVQRGEITFGEKCQNAEAAGAVACIVYNNDEGEFGMDLTGCTARIPCVSIMEADGLLLIEDLKADPNLTVSFPKDETPLPSDTAYEVSDFSSWGAAPDLSLEPDITAPGGNIYSTLNNGEYGVLSGTSMAAPNVSGLAALVIQYIRANNLDAGIPVRELVQNLLVSTATPLVYEEKTNLHFSPRQQGGGLANVLDAITSMAYLTVDGMDTPKAELGADADKIGKYQFSFHVHNFGTSDLYYRLNTVAQTEGYVTLEDHPDRLFMSGTPQALGALTGEQSENMILTYDVDNNGQTNAYDAYLVYLKSINSDAETDPDTAFRYDLNSNDKTEVGDVLTYLNALVGLKAKADLNDQVLKVTPGETAQVTVDVELTEEDKTYLDTYYPNGGYVEGFTFLDAMNGIDLSLAYMGFFGDWNAAPVLDDGFYWELLDEEEVSDGEEPEDSENPEDPENPDEGEEDDSDFDDDDLEEDSKDNVIVGNQYAHVLWTELYGMASSFYPGFNPYVSEKFDPSHISISPDGDGYVDTIDDIYISLLRNARYLTFRYVDADNGEVYYEYTAEFAAKSVYVGAYGQIVPTIYSWINTMPYNFTGADGKTLPNNTHLKLQVEAIGDYEGATASMFEIPVTVDMAAPELLSVVKRTEDDGKTWLDLTFRDNLSVAAVALMNTNGNETYYMEGTVDPEFDENGYRNYTASFDISEISGKLMVVLADYALNENTYGLNVAGAGTPYGDLVAYQFNIQADTTGWVSFNPDVELNEVQINMDQMGFVSAEYIDGYIFAQTETGALYGLRYSDMLKDEMGVEATFIAQLDHIYHDLAYDYVTGQLYGLLAYEDMDDYPTTEVYTINMRGSYTDETTGEAIAPFQETWTYGRSGLYSLCIAVDNNGVIYLLGNNDKGKTELWNSYESRYGTLFQKTMSLDVPMDYAQSMTFDHNTSTLYWAQFYPTSIETFMMGLYKLDPATKTYEQVGNLSGETCGLFAPLTQQTIDSNPIYQNIPNMDANKVGRPVLRKDVVNMNVGAEETLLYDLDPWFTDHKDVIWSSSNENVVTVDENGKITAVSKGDATITVAAASDPSRFDTCLVTVTELTLNIEGLVSSMGAGVGATGGTIMYKYVMDKSHATIVEGELIFAPEDMDFGLEMATSVYARGYIWACEYGNTGMVYQIDPTTGKVVDVLMPVDGDMLFGMTYNENLDTFTGIMNMYLFVDLKMTHEEQEEMVNSYDPAAQAFNYHRINLLPYLLASEGNFVTGEYGQGASSEIVMCGITTIADSFQFVDTGKDYLGNDAYDIVQYNSTQTLVVLDNVGRLWYIDEICGLTKTSNAWSTTYTSATDDYTLIQSYSGSQRDGIIELDNGDGTYNVFYLRTIEETPLTALYLEGTMPRITYHFSDIEFGGYTEDGAPIFALSLYDYWNNATTNELYIYVPEVVRYDEATGTNTIVAAEKFYYLGNTGQYNVIASIHKFEVISGLDD